jgi:hypothetical protein
MVTLLTQVVVEPHIQFKHEPRTIMVDETPIMEKVKSLNIAKWTMSKDTHVWKINMGNKRPKILQVEHWSAGDGNNSNIRLVIRIYRCIHMELQGTQRDPTSHYGAQNWAGHYHSPLHIKRVITWIPILRRSSTKPW